MGRRGREKFNIGSAGRRRTVLQIEPVSRRKDNEGSHPISRKREINPTSISGIGLLGQYAENSDDEEQKSNSSGEENINEKDQTKPSKEVQIDSKLSDFFKEIEAISTEDSKSTELRETTGETIASDGAPLEEQADASTDDQNVPDYVLPAPWQEVCDPTTSYAYYWNTLTNEVSWELPRVLEPIQAQPSTVEQVSQHALPQQEVIGDTQDMSEGLTEDKSTPSDEETLTETKDDTMQITDSTDGEHAVTTSSVADEPIESPMQGPIALPPASEACASELTPKEDTCSSPDDLVDEILEETEQELEEATSKSRELCDSPKPESPTVSRKRERSAAIDMFESDARGDDLDQTEEDEGKKILEYWDEDRIKNAVPEEMPEYPPTPENLDVSLHTLADEHESDVDKLIAVDDGQEKNDPEAFKPTERCEKEDINGDDECDEEVPAKKAKYESESDHESEGDFAEKLLEEFLEGKAASSDDDMDVESDEDEKKDVEEEEPASLLPPEAFRHNQADRLKEDGGNSPAADVPQSQVEAGRTKEETEKLTTEIHDLCQMLSNKLEFLNINKDGLNKLLIVLIQMETRIKDWREGGLSSTYIVKKLREAAEELRSYEQSAVPKGWSCHWDRTYKRYFYSNEKTGESKWDYPQTSTTSESSSVETKNMLSMPADNIAATGSWDTSIMKESASASYSLFTPSLEQSNLYPSNLVNTATYPVVTPSSTISTSTAQDISMLTSSLEPDGNAAATYPVLQPPTALTDVTKDPYRFDDDSPASEDNKERGNTPPPPGLSPPPPPPADVQTVPPPPPPQDDVVEMIIPAPPPPRVEENLKPNEAEQVNIATEKAGVVQFQRSLVDYSDLEGAVHLPNTKVQTSGSSRLSPVPMQTTTKHKKKKSKSSSATIRTSKVKQMSSLVQKWQAIKKQEEVVSEDESDEEDNAAKAEAQIKQWREEHITSGQAAANPNFQKITGDWRERVRKAKLRTGTSAKPEQSSS